MTKQEIAIFERITSLCAEEFDPARLNPNCVVVIPGNDIAHKLLGWSDDPQGWRVIPAPDADEIIVPQVADGYWVRRLWVLYITKTRLSVFPWETEPPNIEEWTLRLGRAFESAGRLP